jgi:hypothetical protein
MAAAPPTAASPEHLSAAARRSVQTSRLASTLVRITPMHGGRAAPKAELLGPGASRTGAADRPPRRAVPRRLNPRASGRGRASGGPSSKWRRAPARLWDAPDFRQCAPELAQVERTKPDSRKTSRARASKRRWQSPAASVRRQAAAKLNGDELSSRPGRPTPWRASFLARRLGRGAAISLNLSDHGSYQLPASSFKIRASTPTSDGGGFAGLEPTHRRAESLEGRREAATCTGRTRRRYHSTDQSEPHRPNFHSRAASGGSSNRLFR